MVNAIDVSQRSFHSYFTGLDTLSLSSFFGGSVSFMVPPARIGTAYGILCCFMNTGATILPYIASWVHLDTNSYYTVETLFIILAIISLSLKIYIYIWDQRKRNGILQSNTPSKDFAEYLKMKENN